MVDKSLRYNEGKPKLGYILQFPTVMQALARILEYGAEKYEDLNWKKGGKPDEEFLDSAMRHLFKFVDTGMYDQESGCNHVVQAIWNLAVLIEVNHPGEIINTEQFNEALKREKEKKCQREK